MAQARVGQRLGLWNRANLLVSGCRSAAGRSTSKCRDVSRVPKTERRISPRLLECVLLCSARGSVRRRWMAGPTSFSELDDPRFKLSRVLLGLLWGDHRRQKYGRSPYRQTFAAMYAPPLIRGRSFFTPLSSGGLRAPSSAEAGAVKQNQVCMMYLTFLGITRARM